VLAVVERASQLPASQCRSAIVLRPPTERRGKTPLRFLRQRRDHHAAELGIDPTLIASRATLGALARDWDKHQAELMSWQRSCCKFEQRQRATSNAKPFKYSVSAMTGMTGWSGDWL